MTPWLKPAQAAVETQHTTCANYSNYAGYDNSTVLRRRAVRPELLRQRRMVPQQLADEGVWPER